jgi:hypothetical protein
MSQTVRKLLGQNLLVNFKNYLEVHVKVYVKVYVKVVYSWFSWNPKGIKQSRNCWVGTCSCTSRAISRCTSRCTSRLSTAGSAGVLKETVGSGSLSFTSLLLCSNFLLSEARCGQIQNSPYIFGYFDLLNNETVFLICR